MDNKRYPLPPFTQQTAKIKVQAAEDAWNTKDPNLVVKAYTQDSEWRNRDIFLKGHEEIKSFLEKKWAKQNGYKLKKQLWCCAGNRIAVRFEYEFFDSEGQWWRAYGNQNWEFDENGFMAKRYASINDLKIEQKDRKFK